MLSIRERTFVGALDGDGPPASRFRPLKGGHLSYLYQRWMTVNEIIA